MIVCKREGKLRGVRIGDALVPYIRGQVVAFEEGREIQANGAYKCGVLFLEFQNQGEMEKIMDHASEYIEYEMEK